MSTWISVCREYGIVVVFAGAGVGMMFLLLKWVLEQFKVELDSNRKERVEYLKALDSIKMNVEEHNARSREFMISVSTEHKDMILTLGRINGYKA